MDRIILRVFVESGKGMLLGESLDARENTVWYDRRALGSIW